MLDSPADLQDFLHSRLELLIADANEAGFATKDVLAGLRDELEQQAHLYEEDPDPADDPDLEATRAARIRIPRDILNDIDTEENGPRSY